MSGTAPIPASKLPLGGEPRVQLLPPTVKEREKSRSAVRLGVMLIVLGLVVAGAITGLGFVRSLASDVALAAANEQASQILVEKAKYAEATQVTDTISLVQEAAVSMTSYEPDMATLYTRIFRMRPAGAWITRFDFAAQAPWGVPLATEDVLAPPRIMNLDFTLTTKSIADASDFVESLSTLPGYSTAVMQDTSVTKTGDVVSNIRLALATDAIWGHYTLVEGEGGVILDDDEESATEPDPSPSPSDTATPAADENTEG